MRVFRFVLLCLIAGLSWPQIVQADEFVRFDGGMVQVCEATNIDAPPPPRDRANCALIPELEIDPHGTALWVFGTLTPSEALLASKRPVSLFVSSKTASRVYLNGVLLGTNGTPGLSRATEVPGRIDTVFYIPRDQLRDGPNEVIFLMSGQHSHLRSSRAILTLGLFTYLEPPFHDRGTNWLAFLTFGAFALAGLYAAIISRLQIAGVSSLTLAAASLFAAGQLLAETLRSIWAYPYPVHDIRLILIIVCAIGTGLAMTAHTVQRLMAPAPYLWLAGSLLVAVTAIAIVPGFDNKAVMAILIPAAASIAISLWSIAREGAKIGWAYFAGFSAFACLILIDPGDFLDQYYFYVLAALVLGLFASQALAYRSVIEERDQVIETRRQLEIALERASSESPHFVLLNHSGRTERVDAATIISLSSAGDYVTVRLNDGREILHTGALTAFEAELPANFLRVHRSHLANTDHIQSLVRLPGGTGELLMRDESKLPISRRIMPRVRDLFEKNS